RLQADVKGIKPYIVQENGEIDNSLFCLYSTSAYFSVSRRQAYQNLQPKLGATFLGEYNQSFRPGVASKTSLAGIVYLPGIAKNHGISALLSYQYEDLENSYQFPDNFTAGRGYAIGGLEFAKRL